MSGSRDSVESAFLDCRLFDKTGLLRSFLYGMSPFLDGSSPYLYGTSPFLYGRSPFLYDMSPFLYGRRCFGWCGTHALGCGRRDRGSPSDR
jgi:hypothetical protein